ncbi:hypothetical protein HID58_041970 [Brassica napus]|uniref:NYN domain-containing protein n=1 Tax=Brassica napus TaxID=3708 RepID=A0ABQ8BDD1_BRANA|nr:hypothetical protein HID58_041970 [Brassica napus]
MCKQTFMSMSISRPRLLLTFKHNHNEDNELIFFSSPHTSQVSNDGSSMASKHEMTDMDQMDFTNTKDIPEADYHGKTQVADLEVVASLKELIQRMKDGVYTARRLVLISGDKGFRDVVDDLRSKEMVVYFIKPERNVCAPLTSGAQSINLSEGKYNNWHIIAKTRSEKVQDRKRARNERMHLERQVGRMAIGEGFETEFKQTDHGKEILRRDPSFSLNDFADKVHDNINRVLSAYTKKPTFQRQR